MEIPARLQERTDLLFQELRSELGKDAANQFVLMRSAIHYVDNDSPCVDPQELIGQGSSSADEFLQFDCTDNSDHSVGDVAISSNQDLDKILESPDSMDSVSYESNPPFDGRSSHFEAYQTIPLCKQCTCEKCKKRRDRAEQKGRKQACLYTVAQQFPRPDLIDMLDKYWETLKVCGLFSDQSREPFQWSKEMNSPVHVQRRQYHLILRKLETEDDLRHWRRFVAEYRTLEGYNDFHREATKQRINCTQARASGENDNNKAHKEYVKHMFPDKHLNDLSTEQAALKKDLQFARRWAILVEGYVEKKGGLVPGLSVGVVLLVGLEIKKRMCERI
jgi:hypothetical protein